MANIVGFKSKHIGTHAAYQLLSENKFNFYADTPFYSIALLQQLKHLDLKLIYIDKDPYAIYKSFKKVGLIRNYQILVDWFLNDKCAPPQRNDYLSLYELFKTNDLNEESFIKMLKVHRKNVEAYAHNQKKPLLMYKFEDGWQPFCDFLGVDVPNEPIPHLNKDTMFDPLN